MPGTEIRDEPPCRTTPGCPSVAPRPSPKVSRSATMERLKAASIRPFRTVLPKSHGLRECAFLASNCFNIRISSAAFQGTDPSRNEQKHILTRIRCVWLAFLVPRLKSSHICRSDKFRQVRNGGWPSINSPGGPFPAANARQAQAASEDYRDTATSDVSDFCEHALTDCDLALAARDGVGHMQQ